MKITEYLKDHIVYLDGGMGTLLQEKGLKAGELPERWNISRSKAVSAIHREYFNAGCHVVNTNTFGANRLKFSAMELDSIIEAAVANARVAARQSKGKQPKWVALDIGPTGRMLKPLGDLDFEEAVSIFAETVKLGVKYGVDLILIETMSDAYETKAALLAAKENSDLPVFVSNAYGADGKLMTGASPAAMVALLEGMGADAVGVNCSLGPKALAPIVEDYLAHASVPVLVKPNAGLPKMVKGRTVYDVSPTEFAEELAALLEKGASLAGGCCGTTPEHISALTKRGATVQKKSVQEKNETCISSYTHVVCFGDEPVLIGERINPTGKKRLKEALRSGDMDYILKEGIGQEERGVHVLDVNVGLPEIDEPAMLCEAVCRLQAVTRLPLQIDTADPVAMERALRRYNGKAMINSVSGKRESMAAIFPLVKKYGGVVVALTLDEGGIPARAEERVAIARRIMETAKGYGIDKKDLIFDPLALTVSADPTAAVETIRAVEMIRRELDCHVSLGVSNVSFGLPHRERISATFFSLALANGLSAAIMNPYSDEMMSAYYTYRALAGLDGNCADYIAYASALADAPTVTTSAPAQKAERSETTSELRGAIVKGLKDQAAALTAQMLTTVPPMRIVQEEIIPALNTVGEGFEKQQVYLPQLLMSAEAAGAAFERIKASMPADRTADRCALVLATVKGDIHDIGKNIVKLLLENYGFAVTDLGRDVPPERILAETVRLHAPIVGLSALMTTTVPAMEETVRLLRKEAPWCKIIVGGAVLTAEYARRIGSDFYAKDAMEAVRCAEEIEKGL